MDRSYIKNDYLDEIIESPKDDILLDAAMNIDENNLENENMELFEVNSDGTVQVNGDYANKDSLNFAIMMTMSLLVANGNKIKPDLDMKFIKNRNDRDKFKIIYGNFPLINHPENKLDSALISKITDLSKTYQSDVDYMKFLGQVSPELEQAMNIIYNHVLNHDGAFQMAIRNNDNYDMAFGMDTNYSNILDAFNDNGAYVSYDSNQNGIVTVNETIPGNQMFILNSTNEVLGTNINNNINQEINNNRQYVKTIDNNEVANANYVLLAIMCVIEVILLAVYFIFLFNK